MPGRCSTGSNQLTRADVTTRNRIRARRLLAALAGRARGADQRPSPNGENLEAMRRHSTADQVMEHLGMPPGPAVGEARWPTCWNLRMERGPIAQDEAFLLLDAWAKGGGLAG